MVMLTIPRVSLFIATLPKAELHMHLEDSLESQTLLRARLPCADPAALRRACAFENLQSFVDFYYLGLMVLQIGVDFYEWTAAYLAPTASQNVRHAEVFLNPESHLRRGIVIEVGLENILAAFADARGHHGITGGVIAGVQRQFDEANALAMIAELSPWRDQLLGLGLGGSEAGHPPAKFRKAFAVARRDRGWGTVAHGGREGGANCVREALDILKLDRIVSR
jgi:adenosine deaminase